MVANQIAQESLDAFASEWIHPDLGIEVAIAPPVLVLGPERDEHEDAGDRQAVGDGLEQSLRLGVRPVSVFEYQDQRLARALAKHEALDRVERLTPAPSGIESIPCAVLGRHVEKRQEGGERHHK